jgi:UDP-N-acetylglucosamine:LPS N-acetylglucosamine transferase
MSAEMIDSASFIALVLLVPAAVVLLLVELLMPRPIGGDRQRNPSHRRILAVSSGGGHWVELLRLRPALEEDHVVYVTVQRAYADQVPGRRVYVVNDATRWNKTALALMAMRIAYVIMRERPEVIVTTGAAPGYFALRIGRLFGARTIWIDSIANADDVSMSGRLVRPYADLWLTQWEHLAGQDGPEYAGAVV